MTGSPGAFGLAVGFDGGEPVLRVHGDVDLVTAPTLGAVLDALIETARGDVVLDLATLEFMGAAGLGVIATASTRLAKSGGVLTVRAAPDQTLRILRLTEVSTLVRIESSSLGSPALGPEQRSGDLSRSVEAGSVELSADLTKVGSIPAGNGVVDAALRLVTALASATVEGADGVSVSLVRHGRLATVASSNDVVRRMDDHQYDTGEGPCLSAAAEGRWFHVESLTDEERWPSFVPRAIEQGIASILSTPLMGSDQPMGALNIYSNSERAFGPAQQELAALFATQASGILADAGVDVTDEQTATRIEAALGTRAVIARAQGVLMERGNISAHDADAALHRSARRALRPVLREAEATVASTRHPAA